MGQILLYAGLAVLGLSVLGGIVFALTSALSGKKLRAQLEREYGAPPKK